MIDVSIVIPHYNRVELLQQTLKSVFYQTYSNWEVIVVDDYSTNECQETIQNFIDNEPRVRFIRKVNELKGASVSRNIGMRLAKGTYVLFLDADDLLAPFALEQRLDTFNKHEGELDVVMAPTLLFDSWPGDCRQVWYPFDHHINPLELYIGGNSYFHTMSGLWDKAFLKMIGGWDESLSSYQDWEFHIRALIQNMRYAEVPEYDNFYRRTSDAQSIASNFFREDIINGRFQAFQMVFEQLTNMKKVKFLKRFRAFVIRQLVQLIDHREKQSVQHLLPKYRLLGLYFWDKLLLQQMLSDGHTWRYRRITKLLTKGLWRNMPFDPWQQISIDKNLQNKSIKALTYDYQELFSNTMNS
jgi:glycosyltransferase involved in cell wall biosynthesis